MQQNAGKSITMFIEGVLNSYSQVFFSKNKIFAAILVMVTFFDWIAGLSGLMSVLTSNVAALVMGFNTRKTSQGYYGFNSLLVGLGIGIYFEPGFTFFLVLIFAAIFTFFLTIWLENYFGKYGLPYLSWPFLFGIWMVSLASRQFASLEISTRGIYLINEIYSYGGTFMVDVYHWISNLPIHDSVLIYFQSLGAIFFQYHLLAGIMIATGLLIYSRIAFLLSLTGFFSAYLYYLIIGANLGELSYFYIGFNYILTAIAIGGFFVIPSRYSFLWVILLTPITSFIITSTGTFFYNLQLSIFSLAFNIVVVLFVYVLKFRERHYRKPELVTVQQFSPEKNLYSQHNYRSRFDVSSTTELMLPFWGEWKVTQAHNGKHTHRDGWRHAWDFEIEDDEGKTYKTTGQTPRDYYCYDQMVIAPADGTVEEIQDGIDDNRIGNMNLEKNWGNTIIIKHEENLYTKISHLKKASLKVQKGDAVKRGTPLARVGNSGRSPVPHIHFQVQQTPFIGSKTINYPISRYVLDERHSLVLKTFDHPQEGQVVFNITKSESLHKAFHFVPGQSLTFEVIINGGEMQHVNWEVKSDLYSNTYLECSVTGSRAWFRVNGTMFYFTHFTGDNNSLLSYFYLGAYKVVLGFYKNLIVTDTYPLAVLQQNLIKFFQDFVAPFYIFIKAEYRLGYLKEKDDLGSGEIWMNAWSGLSFFGRKRKSIEFDFHISNGRIAGFGVKEEGLTMEAVEIES
ncbi:MAG: urea transporter [Bacteroidota bacterium]